MSALKDDRDALNGLLLGYDKPGEIDAVRIRRLSNLPDELEHLVVVRQATMGSGYGDVIQVRAPGVQEHHARLLVDKGQLWIECLAEPGLRLNADTLLRAGSKAGLVSGDVLQLGEARLTLVANPG